MTILLESGHDMSHGLHDHTAEVSISDALSSFGSIAIAPGSGKKAKIVIRGWNTANIDLDSIVQIQVDSVLKRLKKFDVISSEGRFAPHIPTRMRFGAALCAGAKGRKLQVTAKVSDIQALRNGRINMEAFQSRIVLGEPKTDASLAKKIRVMAGILDQTIGSQRHVGPFRDASTTGIYLEGAGALFFSKSSRDVDVYFFSEGEGEKKEGEAGQLKDEIVEVLADYGHTLRALKPTEHIAVQVDPSREAF